MQRNDVVHVLINKHWHKATFLFTCPELHAARVKIGTDEWVIKMDELFTEAGKNIHRLELFMAENKELFDQLPNYKSRAAYARDKKVDYHSINRRVIRKRHLESLCPGNTQKTTDRNLNELSPPATQPLP